MRINHIGFALVEILIVVLIIGILAAIAVPKYNFVVRKTEFTRLQPMVKSLLASEERSFLFTGAYTSIENLDITPPGMSYPINHFGTVLPNGELCSVNVNGQWIFCVTKDKKTAYLVIPINSNLYRWGKGKQYCGACSLDLTDKYNKFCQKIAKQPTPSKQINWQMNDGFEQIKCNAYIYEL